MADASPASSQPQSPSRSRIPFVKALGIPVLVKLSRRRKQTKAEGHADKPAASLPHPATRLHEQQAFDIFCRICEGVHYAHQKGFLHRDLKPSNVLLREDGEPLVADFGLAKWSDGKEGGHSLTLSGQVVGTLAYMAPGQAENSRNVDERADVYSLGAILFRMFAGRDHFKTTGNFMSDVARLRTHEAPKLRSIHPKASPDLELIIAKALSANPSDRYRNVSALLEDVRRHSRGEAVGIRQISPVEAGRRLYRKHRAMANLAIGALSALLLLCIFGLVILNGLRKDAVLAREDAEIRRVQAERALSEAEAAKTAAQVNLEKLIKSGENLKNPPRALSSDEFYA